jgi:glycosyltransferase involved in cell wall biosynthesis
MVLTTADYCMLCGCYEAVSAEKPLITSDKAVLREYFKGAFFVQNNSTSIAEGIKTILNDFDSYQKEISILREILMSSWEKNYTDLEKKLSNISDRTILTLV